MSWMPDGSDPGDGLPAIARRIHEPDEKHCTFLLDDGRSFEVALDTPGLEQAMVGNPVDAALLHSLEQAAERRRLARRIFSILDRRPATRARLRDKLSLETTDLQALEAVLDAFEAQGLIDDWGFARVLVEAQLRARAIGPLSLLQRLAVQGVPVQIAQAVVREQVSPARECELACRALQRRNDRAGSGPREERARQRFLRSRGFRSAAIAVVLSDDKRQASSGADGEDGSQVE